MSYQLPPPTDDVEFELLVRDVLRRVYDDPGIERFGRKGQAQHGIDGFSPAHSTITFQSKLKDTRHATDLHLREILLSEMEEELQKTQGLDHQISRFIFASTFKNDTVLQQQAISLSSTTTTVEYWGWDTINEKIWEYAEALIPIYYSWCPVRSVPGFKQVTSNLVETSRALNSDELNQLAFDYYRINDRFEVVFKVVCNNLDVRNDAVMKNIYDRLEALAPSGTLWLVGDGGSGKTTILHRVALELFQRGQSVFILYLESHISLNDLRSVLSLIKYCSSEQTVLCIDNPAADEETLETLLREIQDYTSNCHVIFAERAHRYNALRRTGTLTYLHGEEESKSLYVRNSRGQREQVYDKLFELLGVSEADKDSLQDIIRNEQLVYVNATYTILLELKRQRKIEFYFDWDDYRKAVGELPTFAEGYKYIALFYLFGVKTPFSTFSRMCGGSDAQQSVFLETFRGLVNEPIVVEERRDDAFRKITYLRTKHEIVSEIFFREHPEINKNELLMEWAERTHFEDALEAQALINIFGAKKNYLAESIYLDFGSILDFLLDGYLREQVNRSMKLVGTLHLAKFWLLKSKGRVDEAIDVLESFVRSSPENLHSRTELAKIYLHQGRLAEAEAMLQDGLTLQPHDVNSRTELARVYQKQRRWIEAETVLLEVLDLRRNDLNSRTELAKIYQQQGRLDEAESMLLQLLQIDKNSIIARTELAKVYRRQNKLDDAESMLLKSLEISPRDLNSRTELAKIYQRQGKLVEAEAILMELLKLEPDDLQARTELAKIYQRQGRLDQAEKLLLESLEIDDKQLHPRTELAKIYQRQGKLVEAEAILMELLKLEPDDLQARTELAKIYQRQGKLDQAEKLLLESLEIDDKQLHPRTELAKIYQRQRKLVEAEAILMELLKLEPDSLQARTELAKIYQRQGKLDQAEKLLLDSLEIDDKQLHARTELAKIYQRQGRLDQAIRRLEEYIELDPKGLHPRTELAKIYQHQGKLVEAETRLLESLEIDDKHLHARTELAKIYQRQGKLVEAETRLLESLEIDDKHLHARTELAKIYQRQGRLELAAQYAEESLMIDPLNDHAMSELLAVWNRQGESEKCTKRFMEFIAQPDYKFTRYSQAPVLRFFQCCQKFGLIEEARLVFNRFEGQLDDWNKGYFETNFQKS